MPPMLTIRRAGPEDVESMLSVARGLPHWFNAPGLEEMARDFPTHAGAVAVDGERVVGFITWAPSPHTPEPGLIELTWMGVEPSRHGQGVGRRLVEALEQACLAEGVHTVQVSTLADSVEYVPYAATRAFYRSAGFTDFRVDPGFYDGDDRLLLRKRIGRASA